MPFSFYGGRANVTLHIAPRQPRVVLASQLQTERITPAESGTSCSTPYGDESFWRLATCPRLLWRMTSPNRCLRVELANCRSKLSTLYLLSHLILAVFNCKSCYKSHWFHYYCLNFGGTIPIRQVAINHFTLSTLQVPIETLIGYSNAIWNGCLDSAMRTTLNSSNSRVDDTSNVLLGWKNYAALLCDESILWHDIWVGVLWSPARRSCDE